MKWGFWEVFVYVCGVYCGKDLPPSDEEKRWRDAAPEMMHNESETTALPSVLAKKEKEKNLPSQKGLGSAPTSVWAHFITACWGQFTAQNTAAGIKSQTGK